MDARQPDFTGAIFRCVAGGHAVRQEGARIESFGIESDSAMHTRGLTASDSGDMGPDSAVGGAHGSGVYAAAVPREPIEQQRRQQQLAVQVAAGAHVIPGAPLVVVESQGLVPEVPKTPAGEQFSAWLRAFNSGERAHIEEVRKLFKSPPGPNVDGDMTFRRMTGGFDLRKIEESSATRMSGLLQERSSDQFARFAMVVEENAPHLIAEWHLDAVPTPAEFAITRLSEAEMLEAAKARIDELVKDERFSGAVLVTKNGKPILSGAYGLADRDKKIPNLTGTKFRVGSMNKMFTATSILQLAQTGKIKLSEPFGKYITDYPNKESASKVTIEQLLTHTGGTGDIFGPQFEEHRKDLRTLQDYVNLYGKRGLEFAPGSRWEYSNYGFLLLGVVVERVSGKSYYEYVRENVYAPAGMSSTASLAEDENVPGRSIGYTSFGGGTVHSNVDTLPFRGTSAGGGYSTVEDLQRFASALMSHKLLNAEYTDLLTTGKVDTPRGGKYAFGFFDDGAESGARHFGHGGGAPGMNGELQIYPQSGYVIAVLANLDPPAASRVSEFIANRLPKN
jgi:D-alanyl-D-alanine carboxypeptidase